MTYRDALARLGEARRFGMKLGLELMRELADELGRPQDKLRLIHIAGTNGKGSTAAFLESCLRAAGHRVGLYTSPHLISVRERVQIDRSAISEDDFAAAFARVLAAAAARNLEATFFELLTALALDHFARAPVDWIVWETGLGGALDATNIVTPEASIITNIGLDHMIYLGNTVREIAQEKAGIIKPGVPSITAAEGEALEVITAAACENNAPLIRIPADFPAEDAGGANGLQHARLNGHDFVLGLAGPHQVTNAACALAALRVIAPDVSREEMADGLRRARWPGRFEVVSTAPTVVVDGAHNVPAMRMLVATWRAFLGRTAPEDRPVHLVFGAVSDKDAAAMVNELLPLVGQVSVVRLDHERSADPQQLASLFAGRPVRVYASVREVVNQLRAGAASQGPVLVTGSLFLAGEFLAAWRGEAAENRLNETLERRATVP
jgi:dihydrofolate synthase/folylpolyglutamate synthase